MRCACFLLLCCWLPHLCRAQTPTNDDCSGALPVAIPSYSATNYFSVDSRNASASVPTPGCTSSSGDDDMWYAFEAASDGLIVRYRNADLPPGSTGVGYSIHLDCGEESTEISCDFNFGDGVAGTDEAQLLQPLVPGQTYYLRVFAQGPGGGTFEFGLQASQVNDDCAGALELIVQPAGNCATAPISTINFGRSDTPASLCALSSNNDDGWYRFTATAPYVDLAYENMVAATGTSTGLGFSLHDGCSGNELGCDVSFGDGSSGRTVANPLSPLLLGETYLLRLYLEGNTSAGTFDFCLSESTCRPPIVRYETLIDNCASSGARVLVTVIDLGSAGTLRVENSSGQEDLVFNTTGRDTTPAFDMEGNYEFRAFDPASPDCARTVSVDVYCPAANQTCETALPLAINATGECTLVTEASNWFASTSEYPAPDGCTFYDGGDIFYSFTAPSSTLLIEVLENPLQSLGIVANELSCAEGGSQIDCTSITGSGVRALNGFTVGNEYSLRLYDRANNNFGTVRFCVQEESILPADLTAFHAAADQKANLVEWQVAHGGELSHMDLFASPNGNSRWQRLASVPARGEETGQTYQFRHPFPPSVTFYRLELHDFDGTIQGSTTVSVQRADGSVLMYPNPATTHISFAHPSFETAKIRMYTFTGRLIAEHRIAAGARLSVADLPRGLYYVEATTGSGTTVHRLVKQ